MPNRQAVAFLDSLIGNPLEFRHALADVGLNQAEGTTPAIGRRNPVFETTINHKLLKRVNTLVSASAPL